MVLSFQGLRNAIFSPFGEILKFVFSGVLKNCSAEINGGMEVFSMQLQIPLKQAKSIKYISICRKLIIDSGNCANFRRTKRHVVFNYYV